MGRAAGTVARRRVQVETNVATRRAVAILAVDSGSSDPSPAAITHEIKRIQLEMDSSWPAVGRNAPGGDNRPKPGRNWRRTEPEPGPGKAAEP
jgi:hypothetical protein